MLAILAILDSVHLTVLDNRSGILYWTLDWITVLDNLDTGYRMMIAESGRSDYIQEVTCDGQPDHPPHHSVTVASSITSLWIVSQYYQVSLTYVS